MGLISRIKTWAAGETLTASDLNSEINNILNNLDPTHIEDESASDAAAQAVSDPYDSGSLVKATSLEVELQQLRYLIAQITGETDWYIDPDTNIAALNTFLASLSLTDHALLVGSGTSPVTPLAAMTDGQLVVGATGADPAPKTLSGDATLAANGALTIANVTAAKLASDAVETAKIKDANVTAAKLASDAVETAKIKDANVTQAKLKTDQGSVNASPGSATWSNQTLPGGEYGFYPQLKISQGNMSARILEAQPIGTSYVTTIALMPADNKVVYAQQRYVTSSGEVFWIFILRDKITKKIDSMYQAPDHPCFGNGGKPLLMPHPFGSYDETKHEIIVINPTDEELAEMRAKQSQPEDTPDRDLLEIIADDYEIDEISKPKWPTKAVTVGLPPDYDEAWRTGKSVSPIKKVIPKVDYVKCRSLKKKIMQVIE